MADTILSDRASTELRRWSRWEWDDAGKRPSVRLANAARRHAAHNDLVAEHLARPSARVLVSK
jgi:hypothetical protein